MDHFTTIRILNSTKENAHRVRAQLTGVSLYGVIDQAVRLLAKKQGVDLASAQPEHQDHEVKPSL